MKSCRIFFIFVLVFFFGRIFFSSAQRVNRDSIRETQDSRNGYVLPVRGHMHILIVFAEIIYDKGTDPCPPGGTEGWPAGKLPVWKNNLFDTYPSASPSAIVSSFFYEASFGNYILTGDYLLNPLNMDAPIQIKASLNPSNATILKEASTFSKFSTQNGFSIEDFDRWTLSHVGHPKQTPSTDNPKKIDHVMIIVRNANYPSNLSGWTSSNSGGRLFGLESDTYSFFCTHNFLPFNILIHEYSHMLFGGNNFHAGGSHSKKAGYSYFPSIQGGWGMMGAAWKSFLTCNAWERRRLGWIPKEKMFEISTLDSIGKNEISTDLDATILSQQGIYLIRDFVTTGDAIRIKLPGISDNVFQQWLWIENHQTSAFNGSSFDRFQYENESCMDKAQPGLYMYMQIDKEQTTGFDIFGGNADYLHPLPANGMWDFLYGDTAVQNPWCINNHYYYPHIMKKGFENPFSGNHEMELVFGDFNINGRIELEEYRVPAIRKIRNVYTINLPVLGSKEHVFSAKGNNYIGIGTNPSTAPLVTTLTAGNELYAGLPPNLRKVVLNGISVSILNMPSPVVGGIWVRIKFDDYSVRNSIRWCADTIVLSHFQNRESTILNVHNDVTLLIDRGLTPTRIKDPSDVSGKKLFSRPTVFILEEGTSLHLHKNAILMVNNGSSLIMMPGSALIMERGSSVIVKGESQIQYYSPNQFSRQKGSRIRVAPDSKMIKVE